MTQHGRQNRTDRRSVASISEPLEPRMLLATVKIMPLGDSITAGWESHDSYRYRLWNSLAQAGYDINFVGTRSTIGSGTPSHTSYDPDNEGHAGVYADQVQSSVAGWATSNHPDIVLLHIGTNDISAGQASSEIIGEVGGIIHNLRTVVPNVKILLAKIIPASSKVTQTQDFNNLIPGLASSENTAQSPVIMVDQFTGFNAVSDNFDGIHPNAGGENKMAAKWYTALQGILPAPPPLPAGTYLSGLTPSSATNGWGPIENDRSNGENLAGDGSTILLNGVWYRKGLGMHAAADVSYNVSGGYTDFVTSIGVDDDAGSGGSVVFKVYIDGSLKYTSPTLTGASATIPLSIPIPGNSTTLRLVVTDAGDGITSDHADWAMARLLTMPPTTPTIQQVIDDTGVSTTDHLTNDPTISLSGVSDPNNTVTITRVGVGVVGSTTTNGSGHWTFNYATTLADGTWQFTAQASDAFNRASAVSAAFSVTIDTARPTVVTPAFNYLTSQSVTMVLSEDVGSYAPTGMQATLTNLTTASPFALAVNYSGSTKTATFTFPSGHLPDGNYRLTLQAGSMPDRAGNTLQSAVNFDLFFLGGDANHDRRVDTSDLEALATNFNQPGVKTFSQGDFNYDGTVDNADLTILAARWQQTLSPPPPALPASLSGPPRRTATRAVALVDPSA